MLQPPMLQNLSNAPVFNTKAVARETGVPADTFRAWERRYGVPQPQRTPGGHRLYSERDIAIIRWLRDRTAEGVTISHAVMLLDESIEATPAEEVVASESRGFDQLVDEFVQALVEFDALQADRLMSEAFAIYPFEQVLLQLAQPALIEVGERWHRGEISVAAEHFATQFVRRKLAGLLSLFDGSGQRGTIIVGCAPSELHDVGALLSSLFLARRGWYVIYLGPQLPTHDLLATIGAVQPHLVCLSASTAETALEIKQVGHALQEAYPQVIFGFGGRIFNVDPALRQQVKGVFLGHDAQELVEKVHTLLARPTGSRDE